MESQDLINNFVHFSQNEKSSKDKKLDYITLAIIKVINENDNEMLKQLISLSENIMLSDILLCINKIWNVKSIPSE